MSPHFVWYIEPKLEEWCMASVKLEAFRPHVREYKGPWAIGMGAVTILENLSDTNQLIFSKQPEKSVHAPCLGLHIDNSLIGSTMSFTPE